MEFEQEREVEEAAVEFVEVKLFDSYWADTDTDTDLNNYNNSNQLLLHQDSTEQESTSTTITTDDAMIKEKYDKLLADGTSKLGKTQKELLAARKQLDESKKQIELLSTLVKILCNWISITLKVDIFDKTTHSLEHCLNKLDWAEIGRISRLLSTTSLSLSTTTTNNNNKSKDLNNVVKEKQQITKNKNGRKPQVQVGKDKEGDQDQESREGQFEAYDGENWDYNHQYQDFIETQQQQTTSKIDNNDHLGSTCIGSGSNTTAKTRPRRSCTKNSPYSNSTFTSIPSSTNLNQKSSPTKSKKRKTIDNDPNYDPTADIKAAAKAKTKSIKIKQPLLKPLKVQEVEEENVQLRNPDFIQLDAHPPQTIKRTIKTTTDNNTEQVVEEEEIDATSLYTAASQIPAVIQERESYFKFQAKELYKTHFEPIYGNNEECQNLLEDKDKEEEEVEDEIGDISISSTGGGNAQRKITGHQCKLCHISLGVQPASCTEFSRHLSLVHPEITRSKFQLTFPKVASIGRQIANVWSHFITLRLGGKNLDSFCKKCHRRIERPKAAKLVHHLEVCGGWDVDEDGDNKEAENDGFWENIATSIRQDKKRQSARKCEERKRRVQKIVKGKGRTEESTATGIIINKDKEDCKKQGLKILPPCLMPIVCEVCGKVIKKGAAQLRIHMVTHSKKRPFKCPKCSYAAKYKYYLKRHDLVMHQGVKLVRKNPPIRRGGKRPDPIYIDESESE